MHVATTNSTPSPVADAAPSSPALRPVRLALLAISTAIGLLQFFYRYLDDVARGHAGTFAERAIEEGTGSYASLALLLLLLPIVVRHPLWRGGWAKRIPLHLGIALVYSAAHTTLNFALRRALFAAFGLGVYDYGILPVRYLMELPNDIIGYALFLAILALFDYFTGARERAVAASRLESRLAQAQLQNLRLQLQPHFLFNALNTISSTMYDDPRAADAMISQLGELLRLSLRTAATHEVPLGSELEMLDHYVALMRARFGEALVVRTQVASDASDGLVPSLLLQPLVENAVRHGGVATRGRGCIDIAVARRNGSLVVEVRDDGPSAPPRAGSVGVGLTATAERLRLLYGDEQRMEAGPMPDGGFRVSVAFPYHTPVTPVDDAHADR